MNRPEVLLRAAFARIGLRWLLLHAGVTLAFCLLGALIERQADYSLAADNALLSVTCGLCLPLLCFKLSGRLFAPSLHQSGTRLVRFGVDRRWLALFWAGGSAVLLGLIAALLGAFTVALAQYRTDLLWSDIATTFWITALGGGAYAAYFAAAARFGTAGRILALLADWLLGSGCGVVAAFWPRAHLRNLLGGAELSGFSQTSSALGLLLLGAVLLYLPVLRTPH